MKPIQLDVKTIDYCQHIGVNPIKFARWKAYLSVQLKRLNQTTILKNNQ